MTKIIETDKYRICYGTKAKYIFDKNSNQTRLVGSNEIMIDKKTTNSTGEEVWAPLETEKMSAQDWEQVVYSITMEELFRQNDLIKLADKDPINISQEERDLYMNKLPKLKTFI